MNHMAIHNAKILKPSFSYRTTTVCCSWHSHSSAMSKIRFGNYNEIDLGNNMKNDIWSFPFAIHSRQIQVVTKYMMPTPLR